MRDVLGPGQAEVLARFAWSNVLIGLDFDGTLAPIVASPEDAKMRARTRALLAALAAQYPVAVLSGRSRADVSARVANVGLRAVVGNHGLEPSADTGRCRRLVARWVPLLAKAFEDEPGIELEDKTLSLAIHYRRSRARREAVAKIRGAIASLPGGVRVIGGKLVFNLVPEDAPHKGIALVRLRRELGTDTALYVGDDVTDEDVFALDDPGRLLSIRVGRSSRSHAPYYLKSQRAIDELLRSLLVLRRGMSQRHALAEGRT